MTPERHTTVTLQCHTESSRLAVCQAAFVLKWQQLLQRLATIWLRDSSAICVHRGLGLKTEMTDSVCSRGIITTASC